MTKLALIGAGGIGAIWAKALEGNADISVREVIDADEIKAKDIAARFNARPGTDWKDAVAEVDAAIVAVPHVFLAPITRGFLEAGKHVLCEKPCGISSTEISANAALAKEKGVIFMPSFNHRYHAAYLEARKRYEAGEIGDLMYVCARYGFGGRKDYDKEWRFNKGISGGGELLDQGVHMIDLAGLYLGDVAEVKGFAQNMFWGGDVEDNGFVLMRNAKGKVAQIHVSWTNWEWVHQFEIYGTKGYLVIDGLDTRYRGPERLTVGHADPRSGAFPEETLLKYESETKEDSFARELGVFLGAIQKSEASIPTGDDAARAMKVVETIYGN